MMSSLMTTTALVPVEIAWRASAVPTYEQCPRRAVALQMPSVVRKSGFSLRETRRHIGAAIGTSAHLAQAHLMTEFQQTGEVGGDNRTKSALEIALDDPKGGLRAVTREAMTWDPVTPTTDVGVKQLGRMIRAYHDSIDPDLPPVLIESGLKMTIEIGGVVLTMTGHVDLFMIDRVLDDLKTGRHQPRSWSQYGNYSLLARANGYRVGPKFRERYLPRVPISKIQPPPDVREYPQGLIEQHAMETNRRIANDFARFHETGDRASFPANPYTWLCQPHLCPAYDTDWCGLGALKEGKKVST